MAIRKIAKTLGVAVALAVCGLSVQGQSLARPSPQASRTRDYSQFRKLADPLRLVDLVSATLVSRIAVDESTQDQSPEWREAFGAALDHGVHARSEILIDTVMRDAFKSFSHDEIVRLNEICSKPFFRQYQTAKYDALLGNGGGAAADDVIRTDPDFHAMSQADQELTGKFLYAFGQSVSAARDVLNAIIADAYREAEKADTDDIGMAVGPPIPVPPVPGSAPSPPPAKTHAGHTH